ncbi:trypsin-like peptidase domain-containing protein [Actinoplanes sp. GCM10030250]|uniref:trypsin-like peptidase domain-containing protein n=1 Tax=Actinoplanes sp. GCM10030250 TaxID=3273376 RepID=UPI00361D4149
MTDCRILLRSPSDREWAFAGSGFVLAGGVAVTANHVVAQRAPGDEILVRTAGGAQFVVESVTPNEVLDVALLRGAAVPVSTWQAGTAVVGARWIVGSRPRDNDPLLSGTVAAADRLVVTAADGHEVAMVQLTVDQPLDEYQGYSGSAVRLESEPSTVFGIVTEQVRSRLAGERAANVLYAVPMTTVVQEFGLVPAAGPPSGVVQRVRSLLDGGQVAEADRALHRVARADRQNAAYWHWKARVALAGGNLPVALAYTEQALGYEPRHAPSVAVKMTILLLQNTPGSRDQARRMHHDSRHLDPSLDTWLDCLGTCGMFDGGVRTPTDLDSRCPLPPGIR